MFGYDRSTYHLPLASTQWRLIGPIINSQAPGVRRAPQSDNYMDNPFYDPGLFIHLGDKVHASPNVSASTCVSPVYGLRVIHETHFQKICVEGQICS